MAEKYYRRVGFFLFCFFFCSTSVDRPRYLPFLMEHASESVRADKWKMTLSLSLCPRDYLARDDHCLSAPRKPAIEGFYSFRQLLFFVWQIVLAGATTVALHLNVNAPPTRVRFV